MSSKSSKLPAASNTKWNGNWAALTPHGSDGTGTSVHVQLQLNKERIEESNQPSSWRKCAATTNHKYALRRTSYYMDTLASDSAYTKYY